MRNKKLLILAMFIVPLLTMPLLAAGETEIDVPAFIAAAEAIFLAGIGGMSVTALVSIIKRWINAHGIAVILISILVSAAATLAYLIPIGFNLLKFIIYTIIVALAANGIYLFPRSRTI